MLYFLNVDILMLLAGAGLVTMLINNLTRPGWLTLPTLAPVHLGVNAMAALDSAPFNFGQLFLSFLKTGAVLYGSGYGLLAYWIGIVS